MTSATVTRTRSYRVITSMIAATTSLIASVSLVKPLYREDAALRIRSFSVANTDDRGVVDPLSMSLLATIQVFHAESDSFFCSNQSRWRMTPSAGARGISAVELTLGQGENHAFHRSRTQRVLTETVLRLLRFKKGLGSHRAM